MRLVENPLIRRVVKNSAYLFSATGVSAALSMIQGILAARLLGVYDFGVLGAITMFTSVVNKLASFRMNELVVKYVGDYTESGEHQHAAAVFKAASLTEIATSFVAYGLIFVLAPLGARFFAKDATTTTLFLIYGFIVLGNLMMESALGMLQIFDRFRNIASVQIGQSILTLSLITVAFVTKQGLLAVLLAYMIGKLAGALGLTGAALFQAHKQWGSGWWRAPLGLLKGKTRELVHFAVSTNISASINLINKDSELLWVSALRSPLEAGYYKLALALSNLVLLPISPFPQATYPELSREVARKSWGNVRYVLRQGSRLAASYTGLAALALIVFGRPLISLIYKPTFLPAYPALLILLVGFLIANTFYWNRTALLSLGHPDYPMKVNLSAAILKIVLALLLVPRYGYLASAALLAGYYAFSISFNVRKTYRELGKREQAQGMKSDI